MGRKCPDSKQQSNLELTLPVSVVQSKAQKHRIFRYLKAYEQNSTFQANALSLALLATSRRRAFLLIFHYLKRRKQHLTF